MVHYNVYGKEGDDPGVLMEEIQKAIWDHCIEETGVKNGLPTPDYDCWLDKKVHIKISFETQ